MSPCPRCSASNRPGAAFCRSCGAALARRCSNGHDVDPEAQFCDRCGVALGADEPVAAPAMRPAPIAERRLVSVLFTDLVGFTSLSESRDPEETRELLSRYFDLARTLVGRYGGTVEKFIGDAVMAVWGTPVATETDAERAVRAALDLVASIPELDPGLQARAGVLTGEAAVTLGAQGEGMVAGDLVNTAARIQSVADPGTVMVGEVTRRATEPTIAYESAGSHVLKGKAEQVPLWRALRVTSGVGGALKPVGLEAPFVGRARELKLIKDLFHGCAQDRRAHLLSVTGIAGIGKSRLAWEFYKYFDGIVEPVYWQRGRCLAYGDGVAYWALADMVRMRARIEEGEDAESARRKLQATLAEHVEDHEERSFIEPRLAHLVGLEATSAGDRQDLFAAWRLFFEKLAMRCPTVLAFEDMQWADSSLLDFVEYLLEWSREFPLYVVTLARPELHDRRPNWGAGQRNFTSLYLEPLPSGAMVELLDGLVPGLPEQLHEQVLARAQGVPLYAVETVRMLLDRGVITQDGSRYRHTGEIASLEVPETLHALIAARLDALTAAERGVLTDGAVLGKTFGIPALAALSRKPAADLEAILATLVRKEVLFVQSDPRSPERGQYGFLQDLVQHVVYETLSRHDRKGRHLAAAEFLESTFAQDEGVAEVLASHYLAAHQAVPDAPDAAQIRAKTQEMLGRAGARAGSIGAPEAGCRYYEQAAALADSPVVEARLLAHAGRLALLANRLPHARSLLERAITIYAAAGDPLGGAAASALLADVDVGESRLVEAALRLEGAVAQLEQGAPTVELAGALAELGRCQVLAGHHEVAQEPLERSLAIAERLLLPEVFVEALTSKALTLVSQGRLSEARILLEAAVVQAQAGQLYGSELRAENNLAVVLEDSDRYVEALELCERACVLALRRGDRRWGSKIRTGMLLQLFLLGRWDEMLDVAGEEEPHISGDMTRSNLLFVPWVHCERGRLDIARSLLVGDEVLRTSEHPQIRLAFGAMEARLLRAEGNPRAALAVVEAFIGSAMPYTDVSMKFALVEAVEAALAVPDVEKADELLAIPEALDPGHRTPFLHAQIARLRARASALRGDHTAVAAGFQEATSILGDLGLTFHRAVAQLEQCEWLETQAGRDDVLLADALSTFKRLGAAPWVDRVHAAMARAAASSPASGALI